MDSTKVNVGCCIMVQDMPAMAAFYRDVLGLETDWDGGGFAEFKTASGPVSFWLYSGSAFARSFGARFDPPKGTRYGFEIAFWLPTYQDVDAEYARLSALDVKFPAGAPVTYPFGIRNFYVSDPEGNLIEIGSRNAQIHI